MEGLFGHQTEKRRQLNVRVMGVGVLAFSRAQEEHTLCHLCQRAARRASPLRAPALV